jgi:LPXTG-motif cell wall-anchored protein
MAEEAAKIEKGEMSNTLIIGICLVVLILGGASLYVFKKKNDKQAELDAVALLLETATLVENNTKDQGSAGASEPPA